MGAGNKSAVEEISGREGERCWNQGKGLSKVYTPVIFSLMLTMNWGLRQMWWEIRFGAENTNYFCNV